MIAIHYDVGDIYFTADHVLVKILVIDKDSIHVCVFKEKFNEEIDSIFEIFSTLKTLTVRIAHIPLARSTFDDTKRIVIGNEPVTEAELDGYRYYNSLVDQTNKKTN